MLPAEMALPGAGLSKDQRRLLTLYRKLTAEDRDSLLAFADFLQTRGAESPAGAVPVAEPQPIPRPDEETVVGAMKRLSKSYHMLDKDTVLHESAALMSAHMMQGRPAAEVIDDLEQLFEQTYLRLIKGPLAEE